MLGDRVFLGTRLLLSDADIAWFTCDVVKTTRLRLSIESRYHKHTSLLALQALLGRALICKRRVVKHDTERWHLDGVLLRAVFCEFMYASKDLTLIIN